MNQRDELSDELISAYFDGELSPDECAHVERLVAGSEDHRQTLAEIRSLANDLRHMPRFRLGEAFSLRVTEEARRSASWTPAEPSASTPMLASGIRGSAWNWPAIAGLVGGSAAALLLAVLVWQPARAPHGHSQVGPVAAVPSTARENSGVEAAVEPRPLVAEGASSVEAESLIADADAAANNPLAMNAASTDTARASANQADAKLADAKLVSPPPTADLVVSQPDSQTAPESAARMLPNPAHEPSPDREPLSDIPFATDQQLLFVFEISLTRKGAERLAFEEVLAKHGIAVDGAVAVDQPLEASLLESRFFDPAEPGLTKQDQAREPTCSLIYAQIRAGQVDEIWRSMQANPGHFSGMEFDLAILPADRSLFDNLRQAINRVPVSQPGVASGNHARPLAARRLTLPHPWRGKPVNQPPRWSNESDGAPEGSPELQPGDTPDARGLPGQPPPSVPLMPGENLGANIDAEVLFVLHLGPA
jgi:hypothetical protein